MTQFNFDDNFYSILFDADILETGEDEINIQPLSNHKEKVPIVNLMQTQNKQTDFYSPFAIKSEPKLKLSTVQPSELLINAHSNTEQKSTSDEKVVFSVVSNLSPSALIIDRSHCVNTKQKFIHKHIVNLNKVQSTNRQKGTKPKKVLKQAKPVPCPKCIRFFPTNCHLRRHDESVHLQIRDHVCLRCKRAFKRKDQLKAHENKKKTCGLV